MVTLWGKANTRYTIVESTDVALPLASWQVAWTNTVPTDLFIHTQIQGELTNAPILFLDAKER